MLRQKKIVQKFTRSLPPSNLFNFIVWGDQESLLLISNELTSKFNITFLDQGPLGAADSNDNI